MSGFAEHTRHVQRQALGWDFWGLPSQLSRNLASGVSTPPARWSRCWALIDHRATVSQWMLI